MNRFQEDYSKTISASENSYAAVVNKIHQVVMKANAETLQGKEFVKDMYSVLNESITPMLALKPFISRGEELAQNDKTVGEIIDIIKKDVVGNGDLNFIINMCKEEHFDKMNRAGVPSPEDTIKSIKDQFSKGTSDTVKMIQDGIFDCLESTLLGDIKKQLGFSENESTKESKDIVKLNESQNVSRIGDVVSYNPVGFMVKTSQGPVAYVEGRFVKLNESEGQDHVKVIDTPAEVQQVHFNLAKAIESLTYNPATNEFEANCAWDFHPVITSDGDVEITNHEGKRVKVEREHIQKLFLDSINAYEGDPTLNPHYSAKTRNQYIKDADEFFMVASNHKNLIKFNNLTSVKKLNEGYTPVVLFENVQSDPFLIVSDHSNNTSFKSYKDLCESCDQLFGVKAFGQIFKANLNEEAQLLTFKRNRLVNLNESNKQINEDITAVEKMISFAEPNSPALKELEERRTKLKKALTVNNDEIQNLMKEAIY